MTAKKEALANLKKFARGMTAEMHKRKKSAPAEKLPEVSPEAEELEDMMECEPDEMPDPDDESKMREITVMINSGSRNKSPVKKRGK
jgi:hypothetical protein